MDKKIIITIENLLNKKKIITTKLLSKSFNINCLKIITVDKEKFIVKFYEKKNREFNAIKAETRNLIFLNKEKVNFFPKVRAHNEDFLIIDYIENNKKKPNRITGEFTNNLINLHSKSSKKFGFYFDTQIGGMRQYNNFDRNWAVFFAEKRLNVIFETICKTNPLPKKIYKKLETLIRNLNDKIPFKPQTFFTTWRPMGGNILFKDRDFAGLIDPGSFYGHNEMEIAYLRWFNIVDNKFFEIYNEFYPINKIYFSYEPIYQLYYSLLNVHLWDRSYIQNVENLLTKIKI